MRHLLKSLHCVGTQGSGFFILPVQMAKAAASSAMAGVSPGECRAALRRQPPCAGVGGAAPRLRAQLRASRAGALVCVRGRGPRRRGALTVTAGVRHLTRFLSEKCGSAATRC